MPAAKRKKQRAVPSQRATMSHSPEVVEEVNQHRDFPQDTAATPGSDNSTEAALLYWLHSAVESLAKAAHRNSNADLPEMSHEVTTTTDRSESAELNGGVPQTSSFESSSSPTLLPTTEVHANAADHPPQGQPQELPPLSSSSLAPRLVLRDVMPLFNALLNGQLGCVVVDVQLRGDTRLLRDPQRFETILQSYEKQSAATLKEALATVQPFFLLHNNNVAVAPSATAAAEEIASAGLQNGSASNAVPAASLYTMDPRNHYPVVPLLAQLLRSSAVAKILLHSRLLYRLLFLFLGTDRVEMENVVDLETWSELGRQLRPSLANVYRVPVEGVAQLEDVQAALPDVTRELLAEEARTIAQQPQPLHPQELLPSSQKEGGEEREESVAEVSDDSGTSSDDDSSSSSSSSCNSTTAADDEGSGNADTFNLAGGDNFTYGFLDGSSEGMNGADSLADFFKRPRPPAGKRREEKKARRSAKTKHGAEVKRMTRTGEEDQESDGEMDALGMLATLTPISQQPLRSAGASDSAVGGGAGMHGRGGNPAAGGGAKRPRSSLQRSRNQQRQLLPSSSTTSDALASVYEGLKSLALFHTHVLSKYFDSLCPSTAGGVQRTIPPPLPAGVTPMEQRDAAAAAPTAAALVAVRCRLSPSEWCLQRTYAQFLCEAMSYHGLFVNDHVFYGMHTILDVQLHTIDDLAERVVTALEERTGGRRSGEQHQQLQQQQQQQRMTDDAVAGEDAAATRSQWMTEERFRECIEHGPGGFLLAAHPKLDRSLLAALAREAARQHNGTSAAATAAVEQLHLSCQLVCLWIALRERIDVKQRLTDMFSKVADRVQARVLERSRDGVMDGTVDRFHAPSTWCEMCFSVHPTWTLHNASTGRIFAMQPNVQTLSKQPQRVAFAISDLRAAPVDDAEASERPYGYVGPPTAADVSRWLHLVGEGDVSGSLTTFASNSSSSSSSSSSSGGESLLFPEQPQWTMRHLYRAPPGCVLVSFDYNQLELRVLAQLSGDATLQQHLSSQVDVLTLTTASLLQLPSADLVQPHQRQAVKVIVYGLLYGMGAKRMDERISELQRERRAAGEEQPSSGDGGHEHGAAGSASALSARQLLARFYQVYPRVEGYLRDTRQEGLHALSVDTLSGRKSLAAVTDPNRRKQRAIAQAIQGGAADIVLCAMRAVHQQRHSFLPYLPAAPLALTMTIHDELVYAVPQIAVDAVARAVKDILEGQARALRLAVPLPVSVRVGKVFGALEEYHI